MSTTGTLPVHPPDEERTSSGRLARLEPLRSRRSPNVAPVPRTKRAEPHRREDKSARSPVFSEEVFKGILIREGRRTSRSSQEVVLLVVAVADPRHVNPETWRV